jgi:alpha/beta superfamily hydrolase
MQSHNVDIHTYDGLDLEAIATVPDGEARGMLVMAHGITVDLNEGGMFARLAEAVSQDRWATLRFSFRGHGRSTGSQRGVTIAGEVIDLECAIQEAQRRAAGASRFVLLGSSFGAVSTGILLPALLQRDVLDGLCLWNPVLDVAGTFVAGRTPWAADNFTPDAHERLLSEGYMELDGTFQVGYSLAQEMKVADSRDAFAKFPLPGLIVHGDQDESVSYDEAATLAARNEQFRLVTIEGSDHGFSGSDYEAQAIRATADWLAAP